MRKKRVVVLFDLRCVLSMKGKEFEFLFWQ